MPDSGARLVHGTIDRIGSDAATLHWTAPDGIGEDVMIPVPDHAAALAQIFDLLDRRQADRPAAVGFRVVHGGPDCCQPLDITPEVIGRLAAIQSWDRDHLPQQLAIIAAVADRWPNCPAVACFDTAFHHAMPDVAQRLAIPRRFQQHGVRRYGFHGLSFTYLLDALATIAGPDVARSRVVLAHLGAGASLAAVRHGRAVDTTMGFTPASGVMMATRPGDLDPGLMLHLLVAERLSSADLDNLVNRQSGLLGVSGRSGDMQRLLQLELSDTAAAEAIELFCYQIRKAIGAMAAVVDGVDAVVFSGGIGAHSAIIRERCSGGLGHLGIALDMTRNRSGGPRISAEGSPCAVYAVPTDEEVVIARQTADVIESPARPPG